MPVNDLRPSPTPAPLLFQPSLLPSAPLLLIYVHASLALFFIFFLFFLRVLFQIDSVIKTCSWSLRECRDGNSFGKQAHRRWNTSACAAAVPVNQQHIITRSPCPFRSAEGLQFIPSRRITATRISDSACLRWLR